MGGLVRCITAVCLDVTTLQTCFRALASLGGLQQAVATKFRNTHTFKTLHFVGRYFLLCYGYDCVLSRPSGSGHGQSSAFQDARISVSIMQNLTTTHTKRQRINTR